MTTAKQFVQNDNGWGSRAIKTQNDVVSALGYLGLDQLSVPILVKIGESEIKDRFKIALEGLATGVIASDSSHGKYLYGLVGCLSASTSAALESIGYSIPFDAMLRIGHKSGNRFLQALNAATDSTAEQYQEGINFVSQAVSESLEAVGLPAQTPSMRTRAARPMEQARHETTETQADINSEAAVSYRNTDSSSSSDPVKDEKKSEGEFFSVHVYGGKFGLCFNASKSMDGKQNGMMVDGAAAIGVKKYDWKSGVKFLLDNEELTLIYGVLVGWTNSVRLIGHGPANDKSFEIERQDGKFFGKVSGKIKGKSVTFACAFSTGTAVWVMALVFAQIMKDMPKGLQDHPEVVIKMMYSAHNIAPIAASTQSQ